MILVVLRVFRRVDFFLPVAEGVQRAAGLGENQKE